MIVTFLAVGILEESLQQYGSLIPIHVDDVVEKLQDIFNESFSQPHRSDTVICFHTRLQSAPRASWILNSLGS